jgi:thioredoxin
MAVVTCPNCGAKNRVDESKSDRLQPVCGKCGQKLPSPSSAASGASADTSHPVTLTDATLQAALEGAGPMPVLVDAWAPWCGPCRAIAPVMDQLAAESGGRYVVAKLNVDENPRTATQYHIDAIPAMLLFKNGKLVEKIVGLQPKQAIAAKLAQHV